MQGRLGGADIYGTALQRSFPAQLFLSFQYFFVCGRDIGIKKFPLRRQSHASLSADKETTTQIALEIFYRSRHRGLAGQKDVRPPS